MASDIGLVSVVVPMRNAEPYIAGAVSSILRQRETPIEVIVVDDGSTDASMARVSALADDRIRVIDGPGRGVSACMNAGLAQVRGSIVMRCDADDLYPEKRIGRQVAWLRAHPDYAASCGAFSMIDGAGRTVSDLPCGAEACEITAELGDGIVRVSFCTYAVRTQAMIAVGGFREYFESAEDIDMQLRLGEVGRVGYAPETLYLYRLHASSLTHRQSNVLREFFERTAHDFHRQRRASGADDLQRGRPPSIPDAGSSPPLAVGAHVQGMLLGRAWREHASGRKAQALGTGWRAVMANAAALAVWKSFAALAVKRAGRRPN